MEIRYAFSHTDLGLNEKQNLNSNEMQELAVKLSVKSMDIYNNDRYNHRYFVILMIILTNCDIRGEIPLWFSCPNGSKVSTD